MGLFDPAWKKQDLQKALASVDKAARKNDQLLLYEIAMNAPLVEVTLAAARQITDPTLLLKCARGFKPNVASIAVDNMTRHADILEIAMNGTSNADSKAFWKLTDQADFKVLAEKAQSTAIRYMAFQKLEKKTPELALDIAKSIPSSHVEGLLSHAVNTKDDSYIHTTVKDGHKRFKELISYVASVNPFLLVQSRGELSGELYRAGHRDSGRSYREYVDYSDCHDDAGIHHDNHEDINPYRDEGSKLTPYIVKKLGDIEVEEDLFWIAMHGGDTSIRTAAIEKIKDPGHLRYIAAHAEPRLSIIAMDMADDQQTYALVVKTAERAYNDNVTHAMERLVSSEVLADVAAGAKLESLRMEALGKLEDDTLRAHVACFGENNDTRMAAVAEITDKDVLFDIAMKSGDDAVVKSATERIDDEDALLEIAKHSRNSDVVGVAVDKISDEGKINQLASGDNSTAHAQVLDRLEDQEQYFHIALTDENNPAACKAARKVTDQGLLEKLFEGAANREVRYIALRRLDSSHDFDAIAHTAIKQDDYDAMRIVAKRVKEKDSLFALAMYFDGDTGDSVISENALARIDDQQMLERIANEAKSNYSRLEAVCKLTSADALERVIARMGDEDMVYEHAQARLSVIGIDDKEELERIALADDIDYEMAIEAVRRHGDPAFMARVAMERGESYIVEHLAKYIDDQPVLESLACGLEDDWAREAVVGRLDNVSLLTCIATEDEDNDVRKCALERLDELWGLQA